MINDPFSPPPGHNKKKFYFLLWRRYFEMGYNITSYIKLLIALFGISSLNVMVTLILGVAYAFVCFAVGWIWYHWGLMELDTEIGNSFNLFVKEMRKINEKNGNT